MNEIARFPNRNAKHQYHVYVSRVDYVVVDADTRSQAAKLAKLQGYRVDSVNMVG